MRPTFMGFETAKSAIFVNQKSIDIVGTNLANMNTNGYTRQRVETATMYVANHSSRIINSRVGIMGQGVEALGVGQIRDAYLDKRFRDEYSTNAYYGEAADVLSDIQSVFDDGNDVSSLTGITSAMEQIFDSLQDFAESPTTGTSANVVMSAFTNMVQVLNQLDSKLTQAQQQQSFDMQNTTARVNELLEELAQLNKAISRDESVVANPDNEHYRPNELYDKRNLLLDELAGYGNIKVTEKANGAVDVEMGGVLVVSDSSNNRLNFTTHEDGTVALNWAEGGEPAQFTGGSLQASMEYINGRGNNVQSSNETPQKGIPYYRDKIDTYANAMAYVLNNSIPEYDPNTKEPFKDAQANIVYKTLIGANLDNDSTSSTVPVTAKNISISDEWREGGSDYFIYSKDIADPSYAQSIVIKLTEEDYTFKSYGESFTGNFEEFYVDFISGLGADLSYVQGRAEASAVVTDDFLTGRDEVSAVSRDEETANLVTFQKSYEAAARVMNVMDELLDVIINQMGV